MQSLTQPQSPIKRELKVVQKVFRPYGWQAYKNETGLPKQINQDNPKILGIMVQTK